MPRKPKFKPEIIRVKLNPEQAVLTCDCWDGSERYATGIGGSNKMIERIGDIHCLAGSRVDHKLQSASGGAYGPEPSVGAS